MSGQPVPAAPDWRLAGERIDTLIEASSSGGVVARERAEELVRLVADLYGAGLGRLLDIVYDHGRLDDVLLGALAEDDLVAGLLLVHGLHPYDVHTRIEQALTSVRPYLGSHGGDVELLEVTEAGVVRLRLLGSCDGCPSSSVTLKLAVEGAIESAAPEITRIVVEDATAARTDRGGVIPVTALRSRLDELSGGGAPGWEPAPQISDLPAGAVITLAIGGTQVLACRIGDDRFAFLDRCGRCEMTLQGAVLARRLGAAVGEAVLRCLHCGTHYDVRRAGAGLDAEAHLTALPLLTDGGVTSVAIPAAMSA